MEVGSGVDVAAHLKGNVWGAAHMELGGHSARVEEGLLDSPRKLAVYCSLPLRCSTNFRALQADDFGKYRRRFYTEGPRSAARW